MMNNYVVVFFVCSLLGWVWESIYCTICQKEWANRGFLYGPVCPIYGFGGTIAYAIYRLGAIGFIPHLSWWQIFLVGFAVSMILEYPTSLILEKLFHARWWDYSNIPLNINGRTSVPTSFAFGLASIVIMLHVMPRLDALISTIHVWIITILSYILTILISVDVTLTVSALTDFQKYVNQLEDSFQNKLTDKVSQLFLAENDFRAQAIKRIAVFKYPISEKLHDEKEKIEEWMKNKR